MTYLLPAGYRRRRENAAFFDVPTHLVYQPHVYELAIWLARKSGVKKIIDIGCGSGAKLEPARADFDLICIDNAFALDLARKTLPDARFIETDLERGLPSSVGGEDFADAVIICSDVIEHLSNPERLLRALSRAANTSPYVLVSTPDRTRARGALDMGPPINPAHTMEWSEDELARLLRKCGWRHGLVGHTVNTDVQQAKATTLAIGGRHAFFAATPTPPSVAAIIHTFNEADVLPEVVGHLHHQGVEVHIFDNWSADGTFELAQALGCASVERFLEAPTQQYPWRAQLEHSARYASTLKTNWIIHHDADEIRLSPWPGVSLPQAIAHVDQCGYNALDFTVLDFRFLESRPDPAPPYQINMPFFEFSRRPGAFSQVKAWKNTGKPVDLASSGGHEVIFEGRKIFPLKFLNKHYPLRGRAHGTRKVFNERLPRFSGEETQQGWHSQYDGFAQATSVDGWPRHHLQWWHDCHFFSEYLVERISGIGILD